MRKNTFSRGDYISLGKAVAKFNRTINELKSEENKSYFPEEFNYKELKENIKSRNELNRYIKNLRLFNEDTSQIYITESDEKLTLWERNVIEQERKIAINRMTRALNKVNKYDKDTIDTLKSNISNLKNFENLKNLDFKDTLKRIHRLGSKDYELIRAERYRQNYYKALEQISNYQNFEKFKKRLDRFKNPISFYNFIQKSEIMKDLFVYYKGGEGLVIGAFSNDEEAFNYALENDYEMTID